jgi:hypothetical protein
MECLICRVVGTWGAAPTRQVMELTKKPDESCMRDEEDVSHNRKVVMMIGQDEGK